MFVASGLLTASPGLAGAVTNGGTLYVNSNGGVDSGTCRLQSHPCATISYALTQAQTGAVYTIKVAGGTYAEQVTVTSGKDVNIAGGWVPTGSTASPTVIDPTTLASSDTDTDSATAQFAIVDAQPGSIVRLSNLTVNGDGAQSQFDSCSNDYVGVYYHDASGKMTNVTVTNIQLPPADFGCQDGLGIYVATDFGSTTPSVVTMSSDKVTAYDKNGITCDDAATVCTIGNSTITGIGPTPLIGQNGIQIANDFTCHAGPTATLSGNTVTGNSYTDPYYTGPGTESNIAAASGMLLLDAVAVSATGNTVQNNDTNIYLAQNLSSATYPPKYQAGCGGPYGTTDIASNNASSAVNNSGPNTYNSAYPGATTVPFGDGVGDGIVLDSVLGRGGPRVTVSGNTSHSDPEYGIALAGATGAAVWSNHVNSDGDGIYLGGGASYIGQNSTGNSIQSNTANTSVGTTVHVNGDGILVTSGSTGNSLASNTASKNANFDFEDLSTGAGTAGTGNNWGTRDDGRTSNVCYPAHDSNPAGLC